MKNPTPISFAAVFAAAILLPLNSNAATILSQASDANINETGGIQNGSSDVLITGRTINGPIRSSVFVFEIPNFGAIVNPFLTCSFQFNYASNLNLTAGQPNVDLYALGSRPVSDVEAGDYYTGAFGGDPTDATALQTTILTPD